MYVIYIDWNATSTAVYHIHGTIHYHNYNDNVNI